MTNTFERGNSFAAHSHPKEVWVRGLAEGHRYEEDREVVTVVRLCDATSAQYFFHARPEDVRTLDLTAGSAEDDPHEPAEGTHEGYVILWGKIIGEFDNGDIQVAVADEHLDAAVVRMSRGSVWEDDTEPVWEARARTEEINKIATVLQNESGFAGDAARRIAVDLHKNGIRAEETL
jgi:hypothetical protein